MVAVAFTFYLPMVVAGRMAGLAVVGQGVALAVAGPVIEKKTSVSEQNIADDGSRARTDAGQEAATSNCEFKYWAFISYSHKDRQWASWLHKSLERYLIPTRLRTGAPAKDLPRRLYPIFLDREELAASSDLGAKVKQCLLSSRFLIVICSVDSARSRWVEEETRFFLKHAGKERLLCFIVSGEPNAQGSDGEQECLPSPLRTTAQPAQVLDAGVPLAADVRGRDTKEHAKLKLIAGMLGLDPDDLWKRHRRRKIGLRIMTASSVILMALLVASILRWQAHRNQRMLKAVRIERLVEQGRQEFVLGSPLRALPVLYEAYREGGSGAPLRFLLARATKALDSQLGRLGGPTNSIRFAAFSPDSSRLLTLGENRGVTLWDSHGASLLTLPAVCDPTFKPSFSADGSLFLTARASIAKVWNSHDGILVASLVGHRFDVKYAAFNSQGTHIVTASVDDTAKVWNLPSGELLLSLTGHTATVSSGMFSPDGGRILTISADNTAKIWDAHTGSNELTLPLMTEGMHPGETIMRMAQFSPTGARVLTTLGRAAQLWNAATGKLVGKLHAGEEKLVSACFNPEGTRALVFLGNAKNDVNVWDLEGERIVTALEGHKSWINAIDMSRDGFRLVTASWDTTARIWDAPSGKALSVLEGHEGFVVGSAHFSSDSTRLVTLDGNGWARIWDATAGQLAWTLQGHSNRVNSISFSRDGTRFVTSAIDQTLRLWNTSDRKLLMTFTNFPYPIQSADLDSKGSRLVTSSGFGPSPALYDPAITVWDTTSGTRLLSLIGHSNVITSAAFSPDDRRIFSVAGDKTVRIWDSFTGKSLETFSPSWLAHVLACTFDLDGNHIWLAANDAQGTVKVWHSRTKSVISLLVPPNTFFSSVRFSSDCSSILTASADLKSMIWDAQTGLIRTTLESPVPFGALLIWSRDDLRVVSSSGALAKLWDAVSGKLLSDLAGHTAAITCAAFAPVGGQLFTADADGVIKCWDVELETRSVDAIGQMIKKRAPWEFRNGNILPAEHREHNP